MLTEAEARAKASRSEEDVTTLLRIAEDLGVGTETYLPLACDIFAPNDAIDVRTRFGSWLKLLAEKRGPGFEVPDSCGKFLPS
jgi:hypothetical protein